MKGIEVNNVGSEGAQGGEDEVVVTRRVPESYKVLIPEEVRARYQLVGGEYMEWVIGDVLTVRFGSMKKGKVRT